MVVLQNGWFRMENHTENPFEMDDLRVAPILGNLHLSVYLVEKIKRNKIIS